MGDMSDFPAFTVIFGAGLMTMVLYFLARRRTKKMETLKSLSHYEGHVVLSEQLQKDLWKKQQKQKQEEEDDTLTRLRPMMADVLAGGGNSMPHGAGTPPSITGDEFEVEEKRKSQEEKKRKEAEAGLVVISDDRIQKKMKESTANALLSSTSSHLVHWTKQRASIPAGHRTLPSNPKSPHCKVSHLVSVEDFMKRNTSSGGAVRQRGAIPLFPSASLSSPSASSSVNRSRGGGPPALPVFDPSKVVLRKSTIGQNSSAVH